MKNDDVGGLLLIAFLAGLTLGVIASKSDREINATLLVSQRGDLAFQMNSKPTLDRLNYPSNKNYQLIRGV